MADLEHAYGELRHLLTERNAALPEAARRSSRIMNLGSTLLAISLARVSMILQQGGRRSTAVAELWTRFGLSATGLGIVLLLLAVLFSIATYAQRNTPMGLSERGLEAVVAQRMPLSVFLTAATRSYARACRQTAAEHYTTVRQQGWATSMEVAGVIVATSGFGILIWQQVRV